MTLAITHTRAQIGVNAPLVRVEVHLSSGLPSLNIVGLPETAVRESKDRVRSALLNSHFEFPTRRITINLSPADLPKEGGRYDLPIALGILAASGQLPVESLANREFIGELALDGELRSVKGVLPAAKVAADKQTELYLPLQNAQEASRIPSLTCFGAANLLQLCAHLRNAKPLAPMTSEGLSEPDTSAYLDLADVKGQHQAKRGLEIAAAGGHNLLFFGPPGTGKTLLASRLPGILPPLNETTALEVATIHSVAGSARSSWQLPPFRNPHHTASSVALVGGGSHPKPGEISLAHGGVLFLDELPEFQRQVLEVLREPLESGEIHISRAQAQVCYPARFQMVAAMNPCPCGYLGSDRCQCSLDRVKRYRQKISGPLLDRIDLQIAVPPIKPTQLSHLEAGEPSQAVRERVQQAHDIQKQRQQKTNAELSGREIDEICRLDHAQMQLLEKATTTLGLSARAYHRTLRVARTIADISGEENIQTTHLVEALNYRQLERNMK
ncbi:YifB family Mg chelatase-like AAA ATPase [Marinibactrum halimedae]|uniref:ATP-dependent protease n=1 Tax=Marinibactrum halimedae TaxID=1444977 RepID=A0AA37T538_9GAMM|nr:YifB family Mg chelatase-like AAA ATPase [Marinibactrum halimedae]MCD9458283.1 YifB family Mg chelatase-like AAA ATPase [Marinibactrum halimedae]GLS27090.1 ATP-dependent protease [Marinibactrum halimedae]